MDTPKAPKIPTPVAMPVKTNKDNGGKTRVNYGKEGFINPPNPFSFIEKKKK